MLSLKLSRQETPASQNGHWSHPRQTQGGQNIDTLKYCVELMNVPAILKSVLYRLYIMRINILSRFSKATEFLSVKFG